MRKTAQGNLPTQQLPATFRPLLSSGVHVLWRSVDEVQLGIDPSRALVLPATLASPLLELFDGNTTLDYIANNALTDHVTAQSTHQVIEALAANGLIRDALHEHSHSQDRHRDTRSAEIPTQQRLMSNRELQSESHVRARLTTEIHVWGLGRLGITIASLLSSAGFPLLRFHDDQSVQPDDLIAWGYSWVDLGGRRDVVAQQITERLHKDCSMRNYAQRFEPESTLHIYAPDGVADYPWVNPDLTQRSMARDEPHVIATTAHAYAHVSSVIQPGRTSCVRCMHLSKCDIDTTWPLVSSQLVNRHSPDMAPIGLVTQTALHTLRIVSDWIDQVPQESHLIYEFTWPHLTAREITQLAHPACGCMWDVQVA